MGHSRTFETDFVDNMDLDELEFSVGPWQNLSESFSWGEATGPPAQVRAHARTFHCRPP
jgi:hypothetical protein